jgi:hypothetical protein
MTDKIEYGFARFSPNYYARSPDGIMLERFDAMDEVLHRLLSLPAPEKTAWGEFLMLIGEQLRRLGREGQ